VSASGVSFVPPTTQNTRAADPVAPAWPPIPQPAGEADFVTFTITVINHGDIPATNVIVSDPLSALQIGKRSTGNR
jgi:hypothetical protein